MRRDTQRDPGALGGLRCHPHSVRLLCAVIQPAKGARAAWHELPGRTFAPESATADGPVLSRPCCTRTGPTPGTHFRAARYLGTPRRDMSPGLPPTAPVDP
ncbi:hypothetical protein AGMMS50218_13040 [Actinomycetota bacterium]|nr:hypothetical protein AGMMS50218_13040 [Actinomycetota bacterium]